MAAVLRGRALQIAFDLRAGRYEMPTPEQIAGAMLTHFGAGHDPGARPQMNSPVRGRVYYDDAPTVHLDIETARP